MPINVSGNSSSSFGNGDLFVQKPYLRTNYIEANIEEDIDLKKQYKIKNKPDPTSIRETASKKYVDNKVNDPRKIKNTAHVDFNNKNLKNISFIKVNSIPTLEKQLTPKLYVDKSIDETSLLRLDPDEN